MNQNDAVRVARGLPSFLVSPDPNPITVVGGWTISGRLFVSEVESPPVNLDEFLVFVRTREVDADGNLTREAANSILLEIPALLSVRAGSKGLPKAGRTRVPRILDKDNMPVI